MPVALPSAFGKYQLLSHLAEGGMADVYLGRLPGPGGFEKRLVIKVIRPELAARREFCEMFIAEAKITVALTHSNIVPVYELGVVDGQYFLAMEVIDGPTLHQLLFDRRPGRGGPLPPPIAAYIVEQVLRGLDYAHRQDVIHRDLSSANVMCSREGEVKIVDFGIAAHLHTQPWSTKVSGGSVGYMAPEQQLPDLTQTEPDARADLYSVGVLLGEMATGRPFAALGQPDLPEDLLGVLRRATQPVPADRYPDAAAMLTEISRYLRQVEPPTQSDLSRLVRRRAPDERRLGLITRLPTSSLSLRPPRSKEPGEPALVAGGPQTRSLRPSLDGPDSPLLREVRDGAAASQRTPSLRPVTAPAGPISPALRTRRGFPDSPPLPWPGAEEPPAARTPQHRPAGPDRLDDIAQAASGQTPPLPLEHEPRRPEPPDPALAPEPAEHGEPALPGPGATVTFASRPAKVLPTWRTYTGAMALLAGIGLGGVAMHAVQHAPPVEKQPIELPGPLAGTLRIELPAGGTLLIDGHSASPVGAVTVAPGPHKIEARAPGRRAITETVVLQLGQTVRLHPVLPWASGLLHLSSSPAGAAVMLDGQQHGVTPQDLEVPLDRVAALRLTARGWAPVAREIAPGQWPAPAQRGPYGADVQRPEMRLSVDLPQLAPGALTIGAVPWAQVYVDGVRRGDTPVRRLSLPAGAHTLRLQCPAPSCKTREFRQSIVIEPRSELKRVVDFRQVPLAVK